MLSSQLIKLGYGYLAKYGGHTMLFDYFYKG